MSLLNVHSSQSTVIRPKPNGKQPSLSSNTPQPQFGSAAQTATKLTFWQTISAIRKQLALGNADNRDVFKGLTMKYGSDVLAPVFFAIPVVGWAAGIVAMPFLWWAERRGNAIIDAKRTHLANSTDKPLYHFLKLQDLWEGKPRLPKAPTKHPETKRDTASRLARSWNRMIDKLFFHETSEMTPPVQALKNKLMVPLHKDTRNPVRSSMFDRFKRFINARERLHQMSFYKHFLSPVDKFYNNFPLPKFMKIAALLPKFGVLAIFYLLKIKPRIIT